jgi:hypothetical protein
MDYDTSWKTGGGFEGGGVNFLGHRLKISLSDEQRYPPFVKPALGPQS